MIEHRLALPAAFPVTVDGALDMRRSSLDGSKCVGDRKLTVIVRVDPDPGLWERPWTSETTSVTYSGRLPPLVSQRMSVSAPDRMAALSVSNAYSEFARKPSKKCSAS
jgi:hypothetical protein